MIDLIAQYLFFMFLLVCVSKRKLLPFMENNNINNKENRDALDAMWWINEIDLSAKLSFSGWLESMQPRRVI